MTTRAEAAERLAQAVDAASLALARARVDDTPRGWRARARADAVVDAAIAAWRKACAAPEPVTPAGSWLPQDQAERALQRAWQGADMACGALDDICWWDPQDLTDEFEGAADLRGSAETLRDALDEMIEALRGKPVTP